MPPREDPNQEYEAAQQRLIADAIADTQDEIFQAAFKDDPEDEVDDGDTGLEEPDPIPSDVVDDDDEEEDDEDREDEPVDEARRDGDDEREPEPDPRRGVPGRGQPDRGQRDRRVADEAREAERAELAALRAENATLRAQQQPRQQPDPRAQQQREQRDQPPDLFVDPEGRLAYERQQVANAFAVDRFNSSMERTRRDVGDERFMQAFEALGQTNDRRLVNQISQSFDPGQALLDWHERQSLLSEIGNDPRGYRDRIREEVLEEMRSEAPRGRGNGFAGNGGFNGNGNAGGPRYAYDLPPSLNSARGGAPQRTASGGGRGTGRSANLEQDIFRSAFDD